MANKDARLSLVAFRAGLFSVVFALSGCRQPQPEVRSLLSFPETWEAARNSDRLFCDYARKIAGETDPVREKLFTQFLASNRVDDIVMLLEFANPVNLREYRMIVVTKRGAYHLSRLEDGEMVTCRLKIAKKELTEIRNSLKVLVGYQSERLTLSHNAPSVVFVTVYERQKAASMFFSQEPRLGLKRVLGGSKKNPHYPAFIRLCEILILAKGENGVVPKFTIMQM